MIIDELKKDFGINKPFFLKDFVDNDKYNYDSIKMTLSKLVKSGELRRYDQGTYYFPKKGLIVDEVIPDFNEIIENKYIKRDSEIFGYYSGISLLNKLGFTTQVPLRNEIVTNNETNIKRVVKVGNTQIILRKPVIKITDENVRYLQFVDIFKYAYFDEINKNKKVISDFIISNGLSRSYLIKNVFSHISKDVKLKILESEVWNEFA